MLIFLRTQFDHHPRRVLALLGLICLGMLAFGMYLQHVEGIEPCPMCIVQRYADLFIVIFALLGAGIPLRGAQWTAIIALLIAASGGAFVAARQSWLQWYPPVEVSCGRDLYGMIEMFPLKRVLPMVFKGSGDCIKVDWTLFGGSIANWSFVWFSFAILTCAVLLWRQLRRKV